MRSERRVLRKAALVAAVACGAAVAVPVGNAGVVASTSSTSAGGQVLAFGDARPFADPVPDRVAASAGIASGDGLYVVTDRGAVTPMGSAPNHGSVSWSLTAPIVDMTTTPLARGYWLVARDGGVFSFGDAGFFGSTGAMRLNEPIVAAAATPSGRGYWLVARDGGVFSFGDAGFFGSTGDIRLNEPIAASARTPSGRGYWLVARDGGVFTFGDARFHGSAAGRLPAGQQVMTIEVSRAGYWLVAATGAVRVAIAGDVHGERHIGDRVRRGLPLLDGVAPVMRDADIAAVNLETPAGNPGQPQAKQYVFLAPPELLRVLKSDGVDVVSLANNHALDHGRSTLLDTISRARAEGLVVVGAGANAAEAYEPRLVDANGRTVGFVGLSMVVPPGWAATSTGTGVASAYDRGRSLDAVRRAAAAADHVVVLVHWGTELARCPAAAQVRFADELHTAGADVVAGHHPHVLQGTDLRGDRATAYSLGNFVWYHNQSPSNVTAMLDVTMRDGALDARVAPAAIGDDGLPALLTGAYADSVRRSTTSGACWA